MSFSTKRRLNLRGLAWLFGFFLGIFCLVVFLMPEQEAQTRSYAERGRTSTAPEVMPQAEQSQSFSNRPTSYGGSYGTGRGGDAGTSRNTSMIIGRDNDSSTTLPPGTKFWVKLSQAATVTSRTMPIIGTVASSVESGNSVAIPEGTRIFGEANLDSDSERASISWKTIMYPDGRSKNLSAIALGNDNQAGAEGSYHSDALKNTAGQLIARFAAGVAEGSITRTPFGESGGGIQNGLLQGAADTAKDRTDAWSDDLKKPRAWIGLNAGTRMQAILSQPFVFRDPGGIN